MFQGFLRSQGIRISRNRVRQAILESDPEGIQMSRQRTIQRREYNVTNTNDV